MIKKSGIDLVTKEVLYFLDNKIIDIDSTIREELTTRIPSKGLLSFLLDYKLSNLSEKKQFKRRDKFIESMFIHNKYEYESMINDAGWLNRIIETLGSNNKMINKYKFLIDMFPNEHRNQFLPYLL